MIIMIQQAGQLTWKLWQALCVIIHSKLNVLIWICTKWLETDVDTLPLVIRHIIVSKGTKYHRVL